MSYGLKKMFLHETNKNSSGHLYLEKNMKDRYFSSNFFAY